MKYTVTMSCGHEEVVELYGKTAERERKLEYFKEYGLCKECYKKKVNEELEEKGLEFNYRALPSIDNDGSILIEVWFSGNTKPYKDDIKSFGGYKWKEREESMFSLKASLCWNKIIKLEELEMESEKAKSIGANVIIPERNLEGEVNYTIALEKQKKWNENKEKIGNIEKPEVPEVLNGRSWNQKVYGKAGNYSVYLDGDKVVLTDEEAMEIKEYLNLKDEYNNKIKQIKC